MTTLKLAIFAAAFATVSAGLANAEQWKTTCVGTLNVRKSEMKEIDGFCRFNRPHVQAIQRVCGIGPCDVAGTAVTNIPVEGRKVEKITSIRRAKTEDLQ
jgi:hypothetical protein